MMNDQQIKNLERSSCYTLRVNDDMKEKVIQEYLNDLEKVVKREIKKSELAVIVVKVS
jgi:hypothetical protein